MKVGEKSNLISTPKEEQQNNTNAKDISSWEQWQSKYGAGATIHSVAAGGGHHT